MPFLATAARYHAAVVLAVHQRCAARQGRPVVRAPDEEGSVR